MCKSFSLGTRNAEQACPCPHARGHRASCFTGSPASLSRPCKLCLFRTLLCRFVPAADYISTAQASVSTPPTLDKFPDRFLPERTLGRPLSNPRSLFSKTIAPPWNVVRISRRRAEAMRKHCEANRVPPSIFLHLTECTEYPRYLGNLARS